MFNHARTLLLNLDGVQTPGLDFLAEELIPREYRTLRLPSHLETVRQRLFGVTPDRAMLNYRGRQLLQLIHCTDLVQFITDLDPRITYVREADPVLADSLFVPQVLQTAGTPANLFITGSPEAPDMLGQMQQSFSVDVLGETLKLTRNTPESNIHFLDLTLTSGLSANYSLPGYGYGFRIDTTNPACAWNIDGFLRPTWDIGQLAANLTSLGETITVQLFGIQNIEPWATFRNLWFQHRELPYRLGGLVLALIYRIEEVRRQNGQS